MNILKPFVNLEIKNRIPPEYLFLYNKKSIFFITLILGIVSGLISLLLLFYSNNLSFDDITGIDKYIEVASKFSNDRYSGKELSKIVLLFLSVNYGFILIGGLYIGLSDRMSFKLLTFLIFIPSFIFTVITTSRAVFLFAGVLFLSTCIVSCIIKDNLLHYLRRNFLILIALVLFIPLMFIFTQIGRMHLSYSDLYEIKNVYFHLRTWFFGNLSGFSSWFDSTNLCGKLTWGRYTFGGIFELIGLHKRKPGTFDFIYISDNFSKTNIYTLFRCLIEDFGVFGTYIIAFIAGVASNFAYTRLKKNPSLFYIGMLSIIYSGIIWSFIISIVMYNVVIFAYFIFSLYLFFIWLYCRKLASKNSKIIF